MFKPYIYLLLLVVFVLQLENQWLIDPPQSATEKFQPSGLAMINGQLLTVSDKINNAIYSLSFEPDHIAAKIFLTLSPVNSTDRQFTPDFEGIAGYGKDLYIVDERNRYILHIVGNTLRRLEVDFAAFHRSIGWTPFSGIPNAGLEGIAYDPKGKKLYVVNERMYRHIYVIDLVGEKIIDHFEVPAGERLPYFAGNIPVYPDYAGACFFDGFLYLLYRNEFKIIKIDVEAKKIIAEAIYKQATAELYIHDEPFGMAEGLALTAESIYLVLDNNGHKLRQSPDKNNSTLLQFHRPDGF